MPLLGAATVSSFISAISDHHGNWRARRCNTHALVTRIACLMHVQAASCFVQQALTYPAEKMSGRAWMPELLSPPLQDVYKSGEQIKAAGGKITREPGPLPGLGTKILATTDPDGWKYVLVDNEDFLKELQEAGKA